jgi:Glycosyl transferases group 1
MALPSLLYYYPNMASFVGKDMAILQKEYRLRTQEMPHFKRHLLPWLFLKQFFHLCTHLPFSSLCVVQFGGHHALLPALICKLFGKPLLIITGGTDTRKVPEIGYGNFNKPLLAKITTLGYRLATAIAPVHQSLSRDVFSYLPGKPTQQGIYNLVPNLHTPSYTIYNGFEADLFRPNSPPSERPEKSFITVAGDLSTATKTSLKGIDLITQAARDLPNCSFTIVGREAHSDSPANITWVSWVNQQELPALLSRHRFYMQLSVTEGFPNALCEGMLCACIPIASKVASMPFIIGQTGHILQERSAKLLTELLQQAEAAYSPIMALAARERITTYFSLAIREQRLLELCRHLVQKSLPSVTEWEASLTTK